MKMKLVTFLALSFGLAASIALAAGDGSGAENAQNNFSHIFVLSTVVLSIILCIYGVYLSRRKAIVIFANYTDILVTASIPIGGWLFFKLLGTPGTNEPLLLCFSLLPSFCIFLVMCWATYLYNSSVNSGICGFLLGLYTKIFLLGVYCLLLFGSLFKSRKKGETRANFEKRNKASTAFISGLLTSLGTSDRRFVSLRDYLSGKWGNTHE